MRVFLSGPMGAGKSTVGAALAKELGCKFVDLDAEISRRIGKTVEQIFAAHGEHVFRKIESDVLVDSVNANQELVLALGGGAVLDTHSRHFLIDHGLLVTLHATVDTLVERVGKGEGRPLLAGDLRAELGAIIKARAAAYSEAHAQIDTDLHDVNAACVQIRRLAQNPPILVALAERSYLVHVGAGNRHSIADLVRETGARDVFVVHDGAERPWPKDVSHALQGAGYATHDIAISGNEENKTIRSVEMIWDGALNAQVERNSLLLAIGGGVVGDLSAFAASTLLRGISLAQVPTTLLAMVDSSVGGKTGFNRVAGKNLVGTFYQPRFVLCDVEVLSTLAQAERIAGLAEVVKSAWLDGESSVSAIQNDAEKLKAGDRDATARAVRMAVHLKARVVRNDERETGLRMQLNLGHTLGHAFEAAGEYKSLRHGEAVALGMLAVAKLGVVLGITAKEHAQKLESVISSLGLPTEVEPWLTPQALNYIEQDKKKRQGKIHWVIPRAPGLAQITPLGVEEAQKALKAAFPACL